MKRKSRLIWAATAAAASMSAALAVTSVASASPSLINYASARHHRAKPVKIEVLAPERGDNAGAGGFGWLVDMEIHFRGKNLHQAGFSGLQLTGPAAHNNIPPFPGLFSPGQDDRMPGLVVLTSTTVGPTVNPAFSGPGTNLAGLFNLTGITNRDKEGTELWDTWIVGAPIAGQNVNTKLTVAVIADRNHDGIYNDAPSVVPDLNHDGRVNAQDLRLLGVASNIVTVPFRINGALAQP